MAQDQALVTCATGSWTQLTNADATSISFQVLSGSVKIRATTDTTAPGDDAAGYVYHSDSQFGTYGEVNITVADLFSAASMVRVWAKPIGGQAARVFVDHA